MLSKIEYFLESLGVMPQLKLQYSSSGRNQQCLPRCATHPLRSLFVWLLARSDSSRDRAGVLDDNSILQSATVIVQHVIFWLNPYNHDGMYYIG